MVGVGDDGLILLHCDLHSLGAWRHRKTVEAFLRRVAVGPDVNGAAARRESGGVGRREPVQDLARDGHVRRQRGAGQAGGPCAGGQHGLGSENAVASSGGDTDPGAVSGDGGNRGIGPDFGALAACQRQLRADAGLGTDVAAAGFVIDQLVSAEAELRVATHGLPGVQHLVRDGIALGGGDGALDEARLAMHDGGASSRGQDHGAALVQKGFTGFGLDLAPDLVGAEHEGHILLAFADGATGDAGVAVGAAPGVRRVPAVQSQHALASPGELQEGGGAHRAQADDDGVVGHGRGFLLPLPPGEGWGKGKANTAVTGLVGTWSTALQGQACACRLPHPDPLPEGEGAAAASAITPRRAASLP